MTRLLFTCLFCLFAATVSRAASAPAARAATSDEVMVLIGAVKKYTSDVNRWAYTQTAIMRDNKGKTKSEIVVRFDPSEPPEKQWTPILLDGKPPTARDLNRYRRRGTQAHAESDVPGTRRKYALGELIQFEGVKLVSEDASQYVFEIPLRKENNNRFPPEKFLVLARVNKAAQTLATVEVRLREAFRQKLVVKVKSGEGTLDFETVSPEHAPTLTSIRGDATVSVVFVNVGGTYELKRKDFKRVKPYDDRFEVQIGEMKALDF